MFNPSKRHALFPCGIMPKSQQYLAQCKGVGLIFVFFDMCLRGVSQTVFMNNPFSGLIIFIAIVYSDPAAALAGLLANMVATASALHLYLEGYKGYENYIYGVYGSNATLVGITILTLVGSESVWPTALVVAIFGLVTTLLTNALTRLMGTLPVLLLPYNLAVIWFLCGSSQYPSWYASNKLIPRLGVEKIQGHCAASYVSFAPVLNGIGEIFFATNSVSGILILVGIVICCPRAGWLALFGSIIGLAMAAWMGVNCHHVHMGLWSYNSVLTAIAVGGGFFGNANLTTFVYGLVGAVITTFLYSSVVQFLLPVGLPAFLLPSTLASLVMLGGLEVQNRSQ